MTLVNQFPDYTGKTIDSGRLLLQAQVGFGGAGVVYRALDIVDPARRTYAVKWQGLPARLQRARFSEREEYMSRLAHEANMHARVSAHPNVVTLHRVVDDPSRECRWMVLDWCAGGDMFRALTERNWWWNDEEKTRSVLLQLADAIIFCHKKGVYHRDIKPENIMINEDGSQIYLGDFGIATTERYSNQWRVGTTAYQSPELVDELFSRSRGRDAYSCAHADAWALSITIFNVLCAVNLWAIADDSDHCFNIFTRFPELNYAYHCFPLSRPSNELIRDALALEPAARLSVKDLRERIATMERWYPSEVEVLCADESAKDYVKYNQWAASEARRYLAALCPAPAPAVQLEEPRTAVADADAHAPASGARRGSGGSDASARSGDSLPSTEDSVGPATPAMGSVPSAGVVSVLDLAEGCVVDIKGAAPPPPGRGKDGLFGLTIRAVKRMSLKRLRRVVP